MKDFFKTLRELVGCEAISEKEAIIVINNTRKSLMLPPMTKEQEDIFLIQLLSTGD